MFRHVFLISDIQKRKIEETRNYIFNESDCVICLLPFSTPSDATTVTRGLSSLKRFSIKQGDNKLTKHLNAKLQENGDKILVHAKCRHEYIDDKRIKHHVTTKTANGTPTKKKLHSQ